MLKITFQLLLIRYAKDQNISMFHIPKCMSISIFFISKVKWDFIQVGQKSIKSFRSFFLFFLSFLSFFLPLFVCLFVCFFLSSFVCNAILFPRACGHPWFCLFFLVFCCWWYAWGFCVFVYFVVIFAFNLFLFQIFNVAGTSSFRTLDDAMFVAFSNS